MFQNGEFNSLFEGGHNTTPFEFDTLADTDETTVAADLDQTFASVAPAQPADAATAFYPHAAVPPNSLLQYNLDGSYFQRGPDGLMRPVSFMPMPPVSMFPPFLPHQYMMPQPQYKYPDPQYFATAPPMPTNDIYEGHVAAPIAAPRPRLDNYYDTSKRTAAEADLDEAEYAPRQSKRAKNCVCRSKSTIPKPPNAFILYRQANSATLVAKGMGSRKVSEVLGRKWKSESTQVKTRFQAKADQAASEHKRLYPDWKPVHGKKSGDESCTCGAFEANRAAEPPVPKQQRPIRACTCNPVTDSVKIPRPKNAFFLYRSHHAVQLNADGLNNQDISRNLGAQWRNETAEVKVHFYDLAQAEKEKHKEMYPDYKYNPKKGPSKCTCGAYEPSRGAAQPKDADGRFASTVENNDNRPSRKTARKAQPNQAPTAVMVTPDSPVLEDIDFGFSIPEQNAEAAATYNSLKRRRSSTTAVAPAPKRRSSRLSAKSISYSEADQEALFQPDGSSRPEPIDTSAANLAFSPPGNLFDPDGLDFDFKTPDLFEFDDAVWSSRSRSSSKASPKSGRSPEGISSKARKASSAKSSRASSMASLFGSSRRSSRRTSAKGSASQPKPGMKQIYKYKGTWYDVLGNENPEWIEETKWVEED